MGRIGRAVAKLAKTFGMEIHYRNRSRLSPEVENGANITKALKVYFQFQMFYQFVVPQQKKLKILLTKKL